MSLINLFYTTCQSHTKMHRKADHAFRIESLVQGFSYLLLFFPIVSYNMNKSDICFPFHPSSKKTFILSLSWYDTCLTICLFSLTES